MRVYKHIIYGLQLSDLYLLREEIVPEFWRNFSVPEDLEAKSAFDQFERAVTHLHAKVASFNPGLQELNRIRSRS